MSGSAGDPVNGLVSDHNSETTGRGDQDEKFSRSGPAPRVAAPKSIRRTKERTLDLVWPDGAECSLELQRLRKECPCAHCKGENILGKVYKPLVLPTYVEGMNELTAIEPVGSYAIRLTWGDGHDTGIYSWEYLRLLCGS